MSGVSADIGCSDTLADVGQCRVQVLALLAMEQPVTLSADDIRDEKVKVDSHASVCHLDSVLLLGYHEQ